MVTIKTYLNNLKQFNNMNKYITWVLKNGKFFKDVGQLNQQEKILIKKYRYSITAKQCYYNSQMLATSNSKFKYYEGWYLFKDIPIHLEHGFNIYNGKVIDTTQYNRNKKRSRQYFGVYIPVSFIRQNMNDTGRAEHILYKYFLSKNKFINKEII